MNYTQLMHQGCAPGRPMTNGGGGGSKGPDNYYNLEQLYGEQARAAKFMLDQSMPYIPGTMQRSGQMVDEAFSGRLADRLSNQAYADANIAIGTSNADGLRSLASYGAVGDPSGGRFSDMANRNAISASAIRAGAFNQARNFAEDQKWNRNAGQFAQVTGMGNGAMQNMNSAAGGFGQMAGQQNQQNMANAQGMGAFGGAVAQGLMPSSSQPKHADGGLIRKQNAYASGGSVNAWEKYKSDNPLTKGKRRKGPGVGDSLGLIAAGAAPRLIGAGLRDIYDNGSNSALGKLVTSAKGAAQDIFSPATAYVPSSEGANDGTDYEHPGIASTADSAAPVVAGVPVEDFVAGGTDAFTAEMANSAASTAAASAAAESMAHWFADGGRVQKPAGLRFALGGQVRMPQTRMPGLASMDASSSMKVNHNPGAMKIAKPISTPMSQPAQQEGPTTGDGVAAANKGIKAGGAAVDSMEASQNATDAVETARVANETIDTVEQADAAIDAASAATDAVDAADTASSALDGAAGGNPVGAVVKGVAQIASGEDAGAAIGNAAGSYGGAEAGAMIGSAVGPVGTVVGGVIGGLLGGNLFNDGGEVIEGREDFTPGGKVSGPGPEMSDSIPAWLDNGEVVHNAEAVRLAGEDALIAINDEGKKARYGEKSRTEARRDIGRVMVARGLELTGAGKREKGYSLGGKISGMGEKMESFDPLGGKIIQQDARNVANIGEWLGMADGGCAKKGVKMAGGGYLGVALGAGVNEYNKQRQMAQEQERHQQQMKVAERQEEQYNTQKQEKAQLADANKHLTETVKNAENFRSGMFDIGGIKGLQKAVEKEGGQLTPEAAAAYKQAMVANRGDNVATQAVSKLSDIDAMAGMRVGDALTKNARERLLSDAGKYIAANDYAGFADFMSDNTVYNDGFGYQFAGQGPSGMLRFAQVDAQGKPVSTQDFADNAELLGFMNASLDPSKVGDYLKSQGDAKRLAEKARIDEMKEDRRDQRTLWAIGARNGGGGGGGGSGSSGGSGSPRPFDDQTPAQVRPVSMKDLKAVLPDDVPLPEAYGYYTQVLNAAARLGINPDLAQAEAMRHARNIATGQTKITATWNPETLGYATGFTDERGNAYTLQSNVDPTKAGIATDAIRKEAGDRLAAIAQSRPEMVEQAKQLLKAPEVIDGKQTGRTMYQVLSEASGRQGLPVDVVRLLNVAHMVNRASWLPAKTGTVGDSDPSFMRDKDGKIQLLNIGKPVSNAVSSATSKIGDLRNSLQQQSTEWGSERNW